MTRVNCVPPSELSNKHLVAEYRELPRCFGLIRRYQDKGLTPADIKIPDDYVLGTGHMLFFVDKGKWLIDRQRTLVAEMHARGMRPQHTRPETLAENLDLMWMNDWKATKHAMALNRQRIFFRQNASALVGC